MHRSFSWHTSSSASRRGLTQFLKSEYQKVTDTWDICINLFPTTLLHDHGCLLYMPPHHRSSLLPTQAGRLATSLSPRALMLASKSAVFFAFQLAPLFPGTAPLPVKPMYRTSLGSWPLSPLRPSLGKHSLPRARDASPVEVPPFVSPQIP